MPVQLAAGEFDHIADAYGDEMIEALKVYYEGGCQNHSALEARLTAIVMQYKEGGEND